LNDARKLFSEYGIGLFLSLPYDEISFSLGLIED